VEATARLSAGRQSLTAAAFDAEKGRKAVAVSALCIRYAACYVYRERAKVRSKGVSIVEPFGKRIAAIRKECGMSQASLGKQTGLGQPRLSRVEKGQLAASVQVINKLAAALGRLSRDLVAGTDREGHYISQALSPEKLAEEEATKKFIRTFDALLLQATYERVAALFDAVYAGPYISVDVGAEHIYIDLRARCQNIINRGALTGLELFFPDHLDPIEEDDVHSWEWTQVELKKSIIALKHFVHDVQPSPEARRAFEEILREKIQIHVVDEVITEIDALRTIATRGALLSVAGRARANTR
jgi:transcriptional regulator with XRE-family HTH domain